MAREPLIRKGSGAAHALSVAKRLAGLRAVAARCRRRLDLEYGHTDPAITLLVSRLEERLEAAEVTAEALIHHVLLHAPAPQDGSEGDGWLCINPGCRTPLYGRRKDAETCGSACRREVSRLRAAGLLAPKA